MVMVPSGLRSGPVACLAAGLDAEASKKSPPLPLETTTGALDAVLLQSSGETPSSVRVLRSPCHLNLTPLPPEYVHPLSSGENR